MWEMNKICGFVIANTSDQASWNSLEWGATTTATITAGLFGWDMTCLANLCELERDFNGYCNMIAANGIDGLAFGIHASIPATSAGKLYAMGFRDSE